MSLPAAKSVALLLIASALLALACPGCGGPRHHALSVIGSTSIQPFAELLAEDYQRIFPGRAVDVQGGGSTAGLVAVSSGLADIGTCSRSLKPEEAAQFKAVLIARDGLSVIVHPSNSINALTSSQIQQLFSGQVRNWKELGGPDRAVWPITREEGSGTRESFMNLVMKDRRISRRALVQESNGTVRELVRTIPGAVGYISLGLVDRQVKALDIDGVTPTAANVVAGSYHLARPLLFVTRGDPSPQAQQFIDYVLSPQGQKTLESEGLVRAQ